MITVERGAFTEPTMFVMQQWPNSIADQAVRQFAGQDVAIPDDSRSSDVVTVTTEGGRQVRPFTITMKLNNTTNAKIVRYNAANGWNGQELETQVSGDTASAQSDQDGIFVAISSAISTATSSPTSSPSHYVVTSSPNQYILIGALVGGFVMVHLQRN